MSNVDTINLEALRLRMEEYFLAGDIQKSFDDANLLIAHAPNDLAGLFRRGHILAMSGHLDESLNDLNRLLELKPDHIDGLLHRFRVCLRKQELRDADADLKALLEIIPDDTPSRFRIAQALLETGQFNVVKNILSEVLEKEPDNVGHHVAALSYRGVCWRHLGAPDMSVEDLSKAMELEGSDIVFLLFERAAAYIELGKRTFTNTPYRKAIDDLNRLVDEFSDKIQRIGLVYNNRGLAWFHSTKRRWLDKSGYQKALADFSAAVDKMPEFVDARHNLALIHWQLKNYDETIAACTETLRLQPENTAALQLRAQAHLKKRERDKAQADFSEIDRIEQAKASCKPGCGGGCH